MRPSSSRLLINRHIIYIFSYLLTRHCWIVFNMFKILFVTYSIQLLIIFINHRLVLEQPLLYSGIGDFFSPSKFGRSMSYLGMPSIYPSIWSNRFFDIPCSVRLKNKHDSGWFITLSHYLLTSGHEWIFFHIVFGQRLNISSAK